jgi:GNAT superfamily N-acetyltransferase
MRRCASGDSPNIIFRRAHVADAAALSEFAARTFTDTYAADNRPDDLRAHLDASFGVDRQAAEIADPRMITIVAEDCDGFVAYTQLRRSPVPPCVTAADPVEIWRFYVDRSAHGTGVASRLMAEAHGAARELGAQNVWLGVWERNRRAIAFYAREGFVDVGTQDFLVGVDRQTDRVYLMPVADDGARR